MKRYLLLFLLLGTLLPCGCDGLRKLAGRPTAGELAVRQASMLAAQEARHRAAVDSMHRVQQVLADSLAALDSLSALDSLRQSRGTILNPSALGGLFTTKLDSRYYIVVGSFRDRSNAESLVRRVEGMGYIPTLISFRNGFNAVGICQTDLLAEAVSSLRKVRREPFCPPDAWILVNE